MALSLWLLLLVQPLWAADRDRLSAFLNVTGYDVVIDSLQLSAAAAPQMAGQGDEGFGARYAKLAREVFDPEAMRGRALDMLEKLLDEDLLHLGAEFYASDLGQRLVAVENSSHVVPYATRQAEGLRIVEQLRRTNPRRLRVIRALQSAAGTEDLTIAGLVEVQLRFILAAREAGARRIDLSEAELRYRLTQMAKARLPEMRREGIVSTAWTYREINDADLAAYVAALRSPALRQLYQVLNRVQYQVMIEFYEKLGRRLAEVTPERDL